MTSEENKIVADGPSIIIADGMVGVRYLLH